MQGHMTGGVLTPPVTVACNRAGVYLYTLACSMVVETFGHRVLGADAHGSIDG
jgi:hypothetical protein